MFCRYTDQGYLVSGAGVVVLMKRKYRLIKINAMKTYKNQNNNSNRTGGGLILLVIGLIFFVRNFGIGIPGWLFGWNMIPMAIGLMIGIRRNFRGNAWLILILVGGYLTLSRIIGFSMSQYYFPIGLVILGLYLILKPSRKEKDQWKEKTADFSFTAEAETAGAPADDNDYIDSVNVFSSSKYPVYSKNFRGGDVVCVFGGCELNLTQADFEDTITLDVVAIFGGVKIIVPPNWIVKSELTPIFGGLEDKRSIVPMGEGPQKIIKIKGVALFGGVDIRNF